VSDIALFLRQHAAQQGAGEVTTRLEHALAFDLGRQVVDFRIVFGQFGDGGPVFQAATQGRYGGV